MSSIRSSKAYYRRPILLCLSLLMLFGITRLTQHWSETTAYDDLGRQSRNELYRFSSGLNAILKKYESVPHQLSINPALSQFLGDKSDPTNTVTMNKYLKTINRINHSAAIYILDSLGNTVAASNYDEPKSFVGHNFSFRPYFSNAMDGHNARYYALGTTSGERGYYFASPISDDDDFLGVVVLKIGIQEIEKGWESPWGNNSFELIVTDPDGVIFISTQPEWRLKSFSKIPANQMKQLIASKRYGDHIPAPLKMVQQDSQLGDGLENAALISIRIPHKEIHQYLIQHLDMPFAGWQAQVLSMTDAVKIHVRNIVSIVVSIYIAIVLLILFIAEHIRNEKNLEQAKNMLELRVKERTLDLEQSNSRLRDEIDERHKAELALELTQEELIQSAKLAVLGQISAGINHELNQPLTAIRSYSQNAQQFLQRGNIDTTESNLQEIIGLTDHMASIVSQLKVFARKSSVSLSPIDAMKSLKDAIKIMNPQIKRQKVTITILSDFEQLPVLGDLIRLEQVFVNLISNACQALLNSNDKQIVISITKFIEAPCQEQFIIQLKDSGPGLAKNDLPHIFEPFFTTKEMSQGLGLGLSISQRIVASMKGNLKASNCETGGAIFEVILPLAQNAMLSTAEETS